MRLLVLVAIAFSSMGGGALAAAAPTTTAIPMIYNYDRPTAFVQLECSGAVFSSTSFLIRGSSSLPDLQSPRLVWRHGVAAKGVKSIDPTTVRFSQSSIRGTFDGHGTIDDLAQGLRSGAIKPGDIPPIRVVERGGDLFTLDNRRLEAFRRAGVPIRYRHATPEEAASEAWKFTTRNDGTSIRVRGGG